MTGLYTVMIVPLSFAIGLLIRVKAARQYETPFWPVRPQGRAEVECTLSSLIKKNLPYLRYCPVRMCCLAQVDVLQSLWLRDKSRNAKDCQGDRWETRILDCVVVLLN